MKLITTLYQRSQNCLNKSSLEKLICETLSDSQRPVIVCNELADWCFGGVITGYEDDGSTLINWGYFPFDDSPAPQPLLTKSDNWYTNETLLIIIGERKTLSELPRIYRSGISAAYTYLEHDFKKANHQFYEDWELLLSQPIEKTLAEAKQTRKVPCTWNHLQDNELNDILEIIDPLWCDYAERRFYAARFIQQATPYFSEPAADSLNQAYQAFDNIHDLMYDYISKVDLTPGIESINKDKFLNPDIRREMSSIVEKCRLEEENALTHLRNTLTLSEFELKQ